MSDKNEWLPVPSLNYKYELCSDGRIRNIKNKHILKPIETNCYVVYVNKRRIITTIKSLLWEVHGIVPEIQRLKKIPVTIKKGTDALYFETLRKAAKYLSPKINYHEYSINRFFTKRVAEICGWQITYHLPDDLSQVEYKGLRIKKHNR